MSDKEKRKPEAEAEDKKVVEDVKLDLDEDEQLLAIQEFKKRSQQTKRHRDDNEPRDINHFAGDGEHHIPKARFDAVNDKFKQGKKELEAISILIEEGVPDDLKELIPNLPPAEKIRWITSARKKGIFGNKNVAGFDTQQAGQRQTILDLDKMSPAQMIKSGYK